MVSFNLAGWKRVVGLWKFWAKQKPAAASSNQGSLSAAAKTRKMSSPVLCLVRSEPSGLCVSRAAVFSSQNKQTYIMNWSGGGVGGGSMLTGEGEFSDSVLASEAR